MFVCFVFVFCFFFKYSLRFSVCFVLLSAESSFINCLSFFYIHWTHFLNWSVILKGEYKRKHSNYNESMKFSNKQFYQIPYTTLNCIWWWGFSPGALENVEYLFITISPRSGVVIPVKVQSMDHIELFDHLTVCKQMTGVKLNY